MLPTEISSNTMPQSDLPSNLTPPTSPNMFPMLDLPTELIFIIVSFLDSEEVVSFSVTCKALYRLLYELWPCHFQNGNRLMGSAPLDLIRFLELLGTDLPDRFMCYRCVKLHNHRSLIKGDQCTRNPSIILPSGRRDPGHGGTMTFGALWPQYAFHRYEARDIVLCNRYMAGANPLLPYFAISTNWKLARLGSACSNPDFIHGYVKLDTEAVVSEGSLFLHKIQRTWMSPDRVKPFLKVNANVTMKQVFASCCHGTKLRHAFSPALHLVDWDRFDGMSVRDTISEFQLMTQRDGRYQKPSGPDGWETESPWHWPHVLGGCRCCRTDYAVTIHNHGRAGVELVLDVFQDLGFCDLKYCNRWSFCWGTLYLEYSSSIQRRREFPPVSHRLFPTVPGKSARDHPSAPTAEDVWELPTHERAARLAKWSPDT
ncbi:hypothetical protein GGS23DRAFT_560862 [Durotheca rogersii]|uniref:uncharacterized protein n=1 Tax=Durotheca rogersii TaxID=419775 RepID=UPI00221F7A5C|nr:uncharacterized protein GGS23DRAFT_560862 [Durotheca rogersii]KAI5864584.1 hypothetical protein GGS23DRAFT_560862 [Durotheca rogersii]